MGAQACCQFMRVEGLEQAAICSGGQAFEQQGFFVAARQQDDRDRGRARLGTQPPGETDAIQTGQEHVRENHVRRLPLRCLPRLLSIGESLDLVISAENFAKELPRGRVTFYQQKAEAVD